MHVVKLRGYGATHAARHASVQLHTGKVCFDLALHGAHRGGQLCSIATSHVCAKSIQEHHVIARCRFWHRLAATRAAERAGGPLSTFPPPRDPAWEAWLRRREARRAIGQELLQHRQARLVLVGCGLHWGGRMHIPLSVA